MLQKIYAAAAATLCISTLPAWAQSNPSVSDNHTPLARTSYNPKNNIIEVSSSHGKGTPVIGLLSYNSEENALIIAVGSDDPDEFIQKASFKKTGHVTLLRCNQLGYWKYNHLDRIWDVAAKLAQAGRQGQAIAHTALNYNLVIQQTHHIAQGLCKERPKTPPPPTEEESNQWEFDKGIFMQTLK